LGQLFLDKDLWDQRKSQRFTLSQYYALSKFTGLYAVQSYQRANGNTLASGKIIEATASLGDGVSGSPSSSSRKRIGQHLSHCIAQFVDDRRRSPNRTWRISTRLTSCNWEVSLPVF
jgi:hypothetical protein